ncbi:hypothetical protein GUJ93_ZPchr0008g13241 [Zizania palustris]|uniref:Uncharacterized protein n=1 Tax=Zizania palustris TaxID=103762 RepID=A0A8J5RD97_ZIZPA|nr:hypothetical protein GUJ93_ZPchr0008g13241 [Zizania palustris]
MVPPPRHHLHANGRHPPRKLVPSTSSTSLFPTPMVLYPAMLANSSCFRPHTVTSAPSFLCVGTKVFVVLKARTKLGLLESSCELVNPSIMCVNYA